MYRITYVHRGENTENPLYIPGDADYCLTDAQLDLEMGKAGELNISIPYDNPARQDIECLTDEVIFYRDDEEIWRGRPVTIQVDFDRTGTLTCEGILAYLYDTYYEPFEFEGSPSDLFRSIISNHNSHVESIKQFTIGEITVTDPNDYINRSSIYYDRSLNVLTEKLINDSLGGYFRVRVDGSTRYIDYLSNYNSTATQAVEFGENILDIAEDIEYSELATVILPLGAKIEDSDGTQTDEYTTIASVNGGSIYYQDSAMVNAYGWICVSAEWEDVTLPSNLLDRAKDYLAQVTNAVSSFTINAVDLSLISDEEPIDVGDYVRIRSTAHGIDNFVELTARTIYPLAPENDILQFGAQSTLTGSDRNTTRAIISAINSQATRITHLSTDVLDAIYANIQYLDAQVAYIETAYVTTEYVNELVANEVTAAIINAGFLTADSAVITDLTAFAANIYTLLGGEGAFGELTSITLTTANATIDSALIVQAVAGTIIADLIDAEYINTDLIHIQSDDGGIYIIGNQIQLYNGQIQIYDGETCRMQIGQDGDGNFTFILYDETGTGIMIDSEGIHASAVPDGLIVDAMVADNAAIDGSKLNIETVTSCLNEYGGLEMDAANITINDTTLDAWYTTVTQQIEGLEGLSYEGLIAVEPWFALWDSDEAAPPSDEDLDPAICGQATCGNAVCGMTGGIVTTQTIEYRYYHEATGVSNITITIDVSFGDYVPAEVVSLDISDWEHEEYTVTGYWIDGDSLIIEIELGRADRDSDFHITAEIAYSSGALWVPYDITADGLYKWVKWKGYYNDGHTEWSIPYCLTDGYVHQTVSTMQTELEVVQGWISARVWYTEIMEGVNTVINEQWSEINIWLDGIEMEVGDLTATANTLKEDVASIVLTTENITSRVESTEQSLGKLQDEIDNLDLEGVSYFETYFCLWGSSTDAPPDSVDSAICGQCVCGTVICGLMGETTTEEFSQTFLNETQSSTIQFGIEVGNATRIVSCTLQDGVYFSIASYKLDGSMVVVEITARYPAQTALGDTVTVVVEYGGASPWTLTEPQAGYGEYLWVRHLLYYEDGHTEWTTPYCMTEQYTRTQISEIVQTATSITERVSSVETWLGEDYAISKSLDTVISQWVTEESANILLEVSRTYASQTDLDSVVEYTDAQIEALADDTSASIDIIAKALEKDEDSWSASIAEIYTYVDKEMASISLEVTGGIGNGSASITLVSGDNISTPQYIDLSEIRQAFADDWNTYVEIAAGTVAFVSNTLVIMSDQFQLDEAGNATFSGNLSAPSGDIGGWSIYPQGLSSNYAAITPETLLYGDDFRVESDGHCIAQQFDAVNNVRLWANGYKATGEYIEIEPRKDRGGLIGFYDYSAGTSTLIGGITRYANDQYEFDCDGLNLFCYGASASTPSFVAIGDYSEWRYIMNAGLNPWGYTQRHIFRGNAVFSYFSDSEPGNVTVAGTLSVGGYEVATQYWVNSQLSGSGSSTGGYVTKQDLSDYALKSDIPSNVSAFTNDAGYVTSNDLSGYVQKSDTATITIKTSSASTSGSFSFQSGGEIDISDLVGGGTEFGDITVDSLTVKSLGSIYQSWDTTYQYEIGLQANKTYSSAVWGLWLKFWNDSDYTSVIVGDASYVGVGDRNKGLAAYGKIVDIIADEIDFNGSVIHSSDQRLKTSIQPLTTSSLDNLTPVSFKWRDGDSRTHYGYIAQEVQPYMPELVSEGTDGMLGLAYTELIPLLHLEIKQLKEQVKQLQEAQQ